MGERTSYAPGTFSWTELATSDADAAKAFYTSIFGWDYRDTPISDGMVYSIALRDGGDVGALYASEQSPHWNCYVTVESVDASAARAGELGATVVAEPFDIFDLGRSAAIADPAGANLYLWEARKNNGATLVNAAGAMAWNDLLTPDPAESASFYGDLFGWTTVEVPGGHGYRVISNGGRSNGGMMTLEPGAGSPSWIPYFGHEDVERLVNEMPGLGGTVVVGPVPVPTGKFALFTDPQGATFAALTGDYDD
jgi:uncharacterized protein